MNSTMGNKGKYLFNIGTPIFMSPEQFESDDGKSNSGTASDVYSFGCIMYEVLFHILPWNLENVTTILDLKKKLIDNVKF
jgi:serine/threonine protein kinase